MYNYVNKNTSISKTDMYNFVRKILVFPQQIYMYNYVKNTSISTTDIYVQLCKEEYYFHPRYICTIM